MAGIRGPDDGQRPGIDPYEHAVEGSVVDTSPEGILGAPKDADAEDLRYSYLRPWVKHREHFRWKPGANAIYAMMGSSGQYGNGCVGGMKIKLLKCKIHRARVTKADLDYEGSISIDSRLMEISGIYPNEAVCVWNISNGERFETYAISAREPGEIGLNGAAARLVQTGDLVIVAAFCWMDAEEAGLHAPRIVLVDGDNQRWSLKT